MYGETNYNATPLPYPQNLVQSSPGQDRRIFDTINQLYGPQPTISSPYAQLPPQYIQQQMNHQQSIMQQQPITQQITPYNNNLQPPMSPFPYLSNTPGYSQNTDYLISLRQQVPGGYAYKFDSQQPYGSGLQTITRPPPCPMNMSMQENEISLTQQIILKQLEKQKLETMLLQDVIKKTPFAFQFHYDCQTQTSDLSHRGTGMPISESHIVQPSCCCKKEHVKNELIKIDTTPKRNLQPSMPDTSFSKMKTLNLTKTADLQKPPDMSSFMQSYIYETSRKNSCTCTTRDESTKTECFGQLKRSSFTAPKKSTSKLRPIDQGIQCEIKMDRYDLAEAIMENLVGDMEENDGTDSEFDFGSDDEACMFENNDTLGTKKNSSKTNQMEISDGKKGSKSRLGPRDNSKTSQNNLQGPATSKNNIPTSQNNINTSQDYSSTSQEYADENEPFPLHSRSSPRVSLEGKSASSSRLKKIISNIYVPKEKNKSSPKLNFFQSPRGTFGSSSRKVNFTDDTKVHVLKKEASTSNTTEEQDNASDEQIDAQEPSNNSLSENK